MRLPRFIPRVSKAEKRILVLRQAQLETERTGRPQIVNLDTLTFEPAFPPPTRLCLGTQVWHKTTGWTGIVRGRSEHQFDGPKILVQGMSIIDGFPAEARWFDEGEFTTEDCSQRMGFTRKDPRYI